MPAWVETLKNPREWSKGGTPGWVISPVVHLAVLLVMTQFMMNFDLREFAEVKIDSEQVELPAEPETPPLDVEPPPLAETPMLAEAPASPTDTKVEVTTPNAGVVAEAGV